LSIIELTFKSHDNVQELFTEIDKVARVSKWRLYTSPPIKDLDGTKTFWSHGLAPASLVYFGTKEAKPYVDPAIVFEIIEAPVAAVKVATRGEVAAAPEPREERKVVPMDVSGGEQGSSSAAPRKVPKWLKLGQK
jgi:hypothetical protein